MEIAFHITCGVRWDSDHAAFLEDEIREMEKAIVRCKALDRCHMALDFFDASINRIAAWVVGFRSWQKALLFALCTPHEKLQTLQDEGRFTELLVMQEELKLLPFGDVWNRYCEVCGVAGDASWFQEVQKYEDDVLRKRD